MATTAKHNFVPNPDAAFNVWVQNFVDEIDQHHDAYLLNQTRIGQLTSGLKLWQEKYAASVAAQDAAKAAVDEKDEARRALEEFVRSAARVIQADDEVTDAARDKAGLPIHKKTRTPVQPPKTNPVGSVIGTNRLELTLQFSDSHTPTRKARPHGVTGCEVYMIVSKVAPTNPEDYRFMKLATRSPETFTFASDDGGQTAHYLLRWINTKGETGPWSPIISATIPAV